jgi:co-chaperonin GroES (HSP10)
LIFVLASKTIYSQHHLKGSLFMEVTAAKKLKKIIIVGDRVLIKPKTPAERTERGLFLPPGVQEREKVQSGYVMKVGPGYPIPMAGEEDELWREQEEKLKYIPLQVKEGDMAIFLQNSAIEVMYEGERYYIVSQAGILMLERQEDLFD